MSDGSLTLQDVSQPVSGHRWVIFLCRILLSDNRSGTRNMETTNYLGILAFILVVLVPSIFLVILYVQTASRGEG